jgi:hypothetical protein
MDAAAAQAWGQFAGDGVAVLAFGAALWQLRQQRQELAELRRQSGEQEEARQIEVERNRKRDELLDSQLADLRRQRDAHDRRQARQVEAEWTNTNIAPPWFGEVGDAVLWAALIANGSDRPIRQASAGIHLDVDQPYKDPSAYQLNGRPGPIRLDEGSPVQGNEIDLVRPGESYLFIFAWICNPSQTPTMAARFVDDAGLAWKVDSDLVISPLDLAEWSAGPP